MAIIRIHETVYNDDELFGVLVNFFDDMTLIDYDKYRKTKDFRVLGEDVPMDDTQITVNIYCFDGIKPFIAEVE